MDHAKIAEGLHVLERKVLPCVKDKTPLIEIVEKSGLSEIEATRAIQWMENKGLVVLNKTESEIVSLDKNGISYQKEGLPERRFLEAISKGPRSLSEIAKIASLGPDEINSCIGILKGKAAILLEKGLVQVTENGQKILKKKFLEEIFLDELEKSGIEVSAIRDEQKFAYDNLSKRKDVIQKKLSKKIYVSMTPLGKKIASMKLRDDMIDALTPKMISERSYEGKDFRRYDVAINVPRIHAGRRHFVSQAVRYIKRIWLELGFREMEGNQVQTSFWDLDALFVPQDHPARDLQDTFYIKDPRYGRIPKEFHKKVKDAHENGGDTGSRGWGYSWSPDIARENLLRTHTTVLSAQTIAGLKESDLPAKFFSVKKVFRNETLGWKSLFEFIQVEGIVVDPDGNFKHLKGYLKNFFAKMGFPDVRIRPAHFPYTEPSAEVDVYHPVKKQWVEFGGAGIFRPEVTKSLMGIEVPVLAWGLGMERSIMQYYGFTDIRDVYRNDIRVLRETRFWMR